MALSNAQLRQRREAAKSPRRRGNRRFRKLARTSGNRQMRLAAGALGKAAGQRSAAEKLAIRRTAATRAVLKGRKQRTGRESRALGKARASYAASVNRMGDRKRMKTGRAGRIAAPKGYYVHEDYSIGRRRKGQTGNYSKAGGVRKPARFGVRRVAAASGVKLGRRRRPRRR